MVESKILRCGAKLLKKICKNYPVFFDHVEPDLIAVVNEYGSGKKRYLGMINNITLVTKLFFRDEFSELMFIIRINRDRIMSRVNDDLKNYKKLRNIVLFHELFHINPRRPRTLRGHGVHDFVDVLKTVGISAYESNRDFPDVMVGEH